MRAEVSIPVALGTAGIVWGVFQLAMPTMAECRNNEANDPNLAASERSALAISAVISGGISLLSSDPTPFVVGGLTAVMLAWFYRHHNMIDPGTQRMFNRDSFAGRTYQVEAQG